ncbi:MAG: hypothetical protein DRI61_08385 [Chloroflexi bacterium]|nr:MAG: hypothetical protein DRI61_08385 [Chloroflexota bacterium]
MLKGVIFCLAYQLWRRRLMGMPLTGWITSLLIVTAAINAQGYISLSPSLTPLWLALAAIIVASTVWAAREGYVTFKPGEFVLPSEPPLQPDEKVFVRASGHFEVEGKEGYFVNLAAAFQTFETREHAVLAYVAPSPLWPRHQVGMWYAFFKPEDIEQLRWGRLYFAGKTLPAIHITYRTPKAVRSLYLASDKIGRLVRIWEDVNRDKPQA